MAEKKPIPEKKRDQVSDTIATEIRAYKETGKIGNTRPSNLAEARAIASAIAYRQARGK